MTKYIGTTVYCVAFGCFPGHTGAKTYDNLDLRVHDLLCAVLPSPRRYLLKACDPTGCILCRQPIPVPVGCALYST